MKRIEFTEVENYFQPIWCNSNELFWYELAWNILADAGLTSVDENDLKRHCEILIYPYVLQMLMGEFSYFMFDESYHYECNHDFDDDVLNAAAVGWLYRDIRTGSNNVQDCFSNDAASMLMDLAREYRATVADVIFNKLGEFMVLYLLYFAAVSPVDENGDEIIFADSKAYYQYVKKFYESIGDADTFFDNYTQECSVMHWIWSHSCALDD